MANGKGKKKPVSRRKVAHRRSGTLKRATAAEILGLQDECELWNRLLHSENDRVVLTALKYLTDRRDGTLYPTANPNLVSQAQSCDFDPRRAGIDPRLAGMDPEPVDATIKAAINDLLPPPSVQVTVGENRRDRDAQSD